MRLLVTGGCGFIGSHFIRHVLDRRGEIRVTDADALTYAGSPARCEDVAARFSGRYLFARADVADAGAVERLFAEGGFDAVAHFAAETHVDRSIEGPGDFIRTNLLGTGLLLDAARRHGVARFLLVSTDEVYGSAGPGQAFSESAPLAPSSPYSASKAGADLLALAHAKTYGQDVRIVRPTNNYGPWQFPEKLIPLAAANALRDLPVPIYGDGRQRRDWLHVEDTCSAVEAVLLRGEPGGIYNVAGGCERENAEVVAAILDQLGKPRDLARRVEDRPGHDRRYAVDGSKIARELGWKPLRDFSSGLRETVAWYAANKAWWGGLVRR